MTRLSVNINKIATLRNARGGNTPDVIQVALNCEAFGADGITVHPRPDERHIKFADVWELKRLLTTEFNIEGNPTPDFIQLVKAVKPHQVTLVPDAHDAITSSAGWNTVNHQEFLKEVVAQFQELGIRVSIFIDTNLKNIEYAALTGTDRVELYTEPYASNYPINRDEAIAPFIEAGKLAKKLGMGLNAGHDLSLENLAFFHSKIIGLDEVSIGHALISNALYFGLDDTIKRYKNQLI